MHFFQNETDFKDGNWNKVMIVAFSTAFCGNAWLCERQFQPLISDSRFYTSQIIGEPYRKHFSEKALQYAVFAHELNEKCFQINFDDLRKMSNLYYAVNNSISISGIMLNKTISDTFEHFNGSEKIVYKALKKGNAGNDIKNSDKYKLYTNLVSRKIK